MKYSCVRLYCVIHKNSLLLNQHNGCAVLAEVGFFWRWLAFAYLGEIVAWMGANPDGLLYSTAPFLGGVSVDYGGVGPLSVNIEQRANTEVRIGCSFASCLLNR